MVCKMASLGFVSAQALPNISLISNAKSVSRSRLLADSAPEKFIFWISVPISFCISTSLSNDALFSLILKKSELFRPKSQLEAYVIVFTSYPHLCKKSPRQNWET